MTKVTILGQEPQKKELKKIEFKKYINQRGEVENYCGSQPHTWDYIKLIKKDYRRGGLDLMFAYDENETSTCLYLGHFNDGVV